ncbi:hypothetical protein V3595_06160 [Bacillus sp. CFBP9009]|nr:hypothetical protein [Peribacillus simplex]
MRTIQVSEMMAEQKFNRFHLQIYYADRKQAGKEIDIINTQLNHFMKMFK